MSELELRVDAFGGSDIGECCRQMIELAGKLGIVVTAKLNDVTVMAKPGADPQELFDLWRKALHSNHPHKVVCAHPPALVKGDAENG